MKSRFGLAVCVFLACWSLASAHRDQNPLEILRRANATIRLEGGVRFSVYPKVLEKSGDWVTVTWENVEYPANTDWIGVYSPPSNDIYQINPTLHAPIKYLYCNHSDTHLSDGKGYLNFRLVNMRHRIIFGFFRGGFNQPLLIAISNTVQFQNPNEPLQAHLALTGYPTEMVLMWVTRNAQLPVVYWGTNSGEYSYTRAASSSTYAADDMCGSPATDFGYRYPGLLHKVKMVNLTPRTQYYYIFGDTYGWSDEYSFTAAPNSGAKVTTTVIAYGDMGCGEVDNSLQMYTEPPSLNTTNLILKQLDDIDFVMHIGDISYAQGYSSVWDVFFDQIQPITTRVPYMVCIGNHERNWPDSSPGYYNNTDSGGECGVPHEMRFPMPRSSLDKPWYGFDYGSVHFVLMSTEHDFRVGSPQYKFLANHLKEVDRSVTPWLVFAGHRPMYVDSNDDHNPDGHLPVAELLRESLEPLLREYEVDLALWAHHHSYQRTCPIYQEVCTEGATTHIVIGMGGRDLSYDEIADERPEWIETLDYEHYGYSRLSMNETTLVFEYVWNVDNEVHDYIVLKK